MTPQLWIGFAFLALLVLFLIIAYFKGEANSQSQYTTLRFLTALCAGFAGGFLTGDALFKMDQTMASGLTIGISGTAGCALFFAIWFSYPKLNLLHPPDTFGFSIPSGWTFKDTVDRLVFAANGIAQLDGFTNDQLQLIMPSGSLREKTAALALDRLRVLQPELPNYQIIQTAGSNLYLIKVI